MGNEKDFYDSMDEEPVNKDVMNYVAGLTKSLVDFENDIKDKEEELKKIKAGYETLKRVTIPSYFKTHGLNIIGLESGETITIKEVVTCSQGKDEAKLREAYQWLKDNGGEHLVKEQLSIISPTSELLDLLDNAGVEYDIGQTVNTNSLKPWLAEKLGKKSSVATIKQEDVPKVFGLFIFDETVVSSK